MEEFIPPSHFFQSIFVSQTEQDSQYPVFEVVLIGTSRDVDPLLSIIHIDGKNNILRGHYCTQKAVMHNIIANATRLELD